MKFKLLSLAGLVSVLAICSGCASASVGTKIDQDTTAKIQKNVTTRDQVIALLGTPQGDNLSGNGQEILVYTYAHTQVSGTSYIPIIGGFIGHTDANSQTYQVVLNDKKIVVDTLWSTTTGGGNQSL